ncbi:capsular polysaccharide synthesis enzyme CpsA sugar transferase [Vibrio astriarenae]|nr:capsular polysaccharide synthesis enzyme CpsA sugar transferase [Vibrio sp. C7]
MNKHHKGLIRSHETGFTFVYRLVDIVLVICTLFFLNEAYLSAFTKDYLLVGALGTFTYFLLGESSHLYRSWRTTTLKAHILNTLLCWFTAAVCIVTVLYFTKSSENFSRIVLGGWFVLTPILLVFWRIALRLFLQAARKRGFNARRAIIVGHTAQGIALAQELESHSHHGVIFEASTMNAKKAAPKLNQTTEFMAMLKRHLN